MIGIEELTREELIGWIRKNVPGIDEEDMVLQAFYQRCDLAWEGCTAASKRAMEINDQIIALFQPYADGPIRPGVRLQRYPAAVQQEYNRLDQERQLALSDRNAWYGKYKDASQKVHDLIMDRFNRIMADGH